MGVPTCQSGYQLSKARSSPPPLSYLPDAQGELYSWLTIKSFGVGGDPFSNPLPATTFFKDPYLVKAGAPMHAFGPDDTIDPPGTMGNWFLTDESSIYGSQATEQIPAEKKWFYFAFTKGVSSIGMDIYDMFSSEGAAFAELTLYGSDKSALAAPATIGSSSVDGGVSRIIASTQNNQFNAYYAVLRFFKYTTSNTVANGSDQTIGIDNLAINVVPEPASLSLLGLGLAGLAVRWMRRQH